MRDYYEVLGLKEDANIKEIEESFKKLSRKYHPDLANEKEKKTYEEKFKDISQAYEVLKDTNKRKEYDMKKKFGSNSNFSNNNGDFSNFSNFSNFGDIGDMFNFDLDNMFNKSNKTNRVKLSVTLEDIFYGNKKKIEFTSKVECVYCNKSMKKCTNCNGAGYISGFIFASECNSCSGRGKTYLKCNYCNNKRTTDKTEGIEITIPRWIESGNLLKIDNYKDLIIEIKVEEHKHFQRNQDNLLLKLNINIIDLFLQEELEIVGIDNTKISIKIPEGTTNKRIIKLSGEGMYNNMGNRGDLVISIIAEEVPKLTKHQKEELRKIFNKI